MNNMRIIYKQPKSLPCSILDISNCYFKYINFKLKAEKIIDEAKIHHHTEYEIHLVSSGTQDYALCGQCAHLADGMFIIIPPHVKHRAVSIPQNVQKFAITFQTDYVAEYDFFVGEINETIRQNLEFIVEESRNPHYYSSTLIGNRVFETVLMLFRISGYREAPMAADPETTDERLILAKMYIRDNILQSISVTDVADYCRLSTRQLTRIFLKSEGIPLSKYITQVKMQALKEDVMSGTSSLKEISEKYNYNNEYYFNRAFKKHFGMSPGAYRQMYIKQDMKSD